MNHDEVRAAVTAMIARKTGLNVTLLSDDKRLFEDLGVDGDDAEELLGEISAMYPIDFSRFDFSKHFAGEPHLLNTFLRRPRTEPLTVGQLIAAAICGTLASNS